jgi:hypothetical protein
VKLGLDHCSGLDSDEPSDCVVREKLSSFEFPEMLARGGDPLAARLGLSEVQVGH